MYSENVGANNLMLIAVNTEKIFKHIVFLCQEWKAKKNSDVPGEFKFFIFETSNFRCKRIIDMAHKEFIKDTGEKISLHDRRIACKCLKDYVAVRADELG